MRLLIAALAALLASCATPAHRSRAPDAIEVVYHPEAMFYTIEDGGRARMVGAEDQRVFEFEASHEDFRRIAEMLAPLEAEGLPCTSPPDHSPPGYIIFRRDGIERRVSAYFTCYADGERPLRRYTDDAYYAMREMGQARYVAPAIPAPTTITVTHEYWGRIESSWSVARGGEGRFTEGERSVTFPVSAEAFDRIREQFHPYEGAWFECRRVITDGPYGHIIWSSQEGREDQRTRFDAGCTSGDADALLERLERAEAMVGALRDAAR